MTSLVAGLAAPDSKSMHAPSSHASDTVTRKMRHMLQKPWPMTGKPSLQFPLIASLVLTLAGCGGGGGGGGGGSTPPPTPATSLARFAYVANFGDDTLSIFIADNTTGQLRHKGYAITGAGPVDTVLHPSGEFAYSVNYTAQTIGLFAIDWTSGDLVPASCDGIAADCSVGGNPTSMVIDSNGLHAYVSDDSTNSITLFEVNPVSGTLGTSMQTVASGGTAPSALYLHPNGEYLYAANENSNDIGLFNIDPLDGTLTNSGTVVTSSGTAITDILLSDDGQHAYIANQGSANIEAFDINASGVLSSTGTVAAGGAVERLVIDPTGSWLYAVNADASGSISAFAVQADGSLTATNCSTGPLCTIGGTPESIAVDPSGQFLAVTNGDDDTIDRFTINQTDGSLSNQQTLTARDQPNGIAYLQDTSAVSITPRFAYVAHEFSNSVTSFSINAGSGALSSAGSVSPGPSPKFITADPTGRFVYVTTTGDDAISAYSVNASTGALSLIGGASTPVTQSDPESIAIDPSGRFLYLGNTGSDSISVYNINSDGSLTQVGLPVVTAFGNDPSSVAVDPSGRFLYVANRSSSDLWAYSIDAADGTLTAIGAPLSGTNMGGPVSIAIDASGRFLYTANSSLVAGKCWISGFAIDANAGTLTELGTSPFSAETATSFNCNPTSVAADPLGETIYAAATTDRIITYDMNQSTGELTVSSNALTSNDPFSLAIEASGSYLYSANILGQDVSSFTISSSDGSLTEIGSPTVTGGNGPRSITTVSTFQ